MDDVERTLIARLKATAAVSAIVGGRVFGETAPQQATLPYVCVSVDRDSREVNGDLIQATATVACWAKTAAAAGALADAVGSLHRLRGQFDGVAVRSVFEEGRQNIDESAGDGGELGRRGRSVLLRVFIIKT